MIIRLTIEGGLEVKDLRLREEARCFAHAHCARVHGMPRPSCTTLWGCLSQPVAHLRPATGRAGLQNSPRTLFGATYSTASERERAKSLDRYYNDIVKHQSRAQQAHSRPPPPPSPADSPPKTEKEATIERARIVFGSRLAGPAQRRRELDNASTKIAGVLVPPRPDEPDNCCMSGCVNCVWDRYREELEEWAEKSAQAREALRAQRREEPHGRIRSRGSSEASGNAPGEDMPTHVASSMDDDGGGSEALWAGTDDDKSPGVGGGKSDDLLASVPVGIKEFMRIEKKLREKKKQKTKIKD